MAPNMLAAALPLLLVYQLVISGAENFAQNSHANIATAYQSPSPEETTKLPESCVTHSDIVSESENLTQNSSANIVALNQSPSPEELPKLHEGYVAYPDIGMAYKIYNERGTWAAARKRCIDRGSQLALIDTPEKVEHVVNQLNSYEGLWVGIHKVDGSWVSSSDGSPASSRMPWFWPDDRLDANCACLDTALAKNFPENCNESWGNSVCEIPIPKSDLTQ